MKIIDPMHKFAILLICVQIFVVGSITANTLIQIQPTDQDSTRQVTTKYLPYIYANPLDTIEPDSLVYDSLQKRQDSLKMQMQMQINEMDELLEKKQNKL